MSIRDTKVVGKTNKFVGMEREAWFLPVEGDGKNPTLAAMLRAIFGEKLDDDEFRAHCDEMLEDGRMLLGYLRKSGEVEVHTLLDTPSASVVARLREVFGEAKVSGNGWTVGGESQDEEDRG